MRIEVGGTAAHGSTPWLGDNAVLKALDVFRAIESLPFARESSDLFDRPSINLGRILGGDAINKVPDLCVIDVDIRYLPGQDPEAILAEVQAIPDATLVRTFHRHPAMVERENRFVQALGEAISRVAPPQSEQLGVGRDGASDAISFLEAGVPAVECGPTGDGHHGPEEWVSIRSLSEYRRALVEFVTAPTRPTRSRRGRPPACASPDRCLRRHPPPRPLEALLLGAFLVIFAAAGATAVAAFHEVDKVVDALKHGPDAASWASSRSPRPTRASRRRS